MAFPTSLNVLFTVSFVTLAIKHT
uniref:Uncharacterized protein n=1 Tax=Anguilla anguilla TaxID=7936 RepID=A0A0E9RAX5_ANGAN